MLLERRDADDCCGVIAGDLFPPDPDEGDLCNLFPPDESRSQLIPPGTGESFMGSTLARPARYEDDGEGELFIV